MTIDLIQSTIDIPQEPVNEQQVSCDDVQNNFTEILDVKTNELKNTSTLVDVKKKSADNDFADTIQNFKEILQKATGEINVANALNLTLAKDAVEVVEQIQDTVKDLFNTDSDITEETINESELVIISSFENTENINNLTSEPQDSTITNEAQTEMNNPIQLKNENDIVEQIFPISVSMSIKNIDNNTQQPELTVNVKSDFNASKLIQDFSVKNDTDKTFDDDNTLKIDENLVEDLNIEEISSDAEYSSQDSMMENQSLEEHGVKVMLNRETEKFDLNIAKSATNTQNTSNIQEMNSAKIIEQITKQMDSLKSGNKLNIVMNPESLGKVNLQIVNGKDGLTAQFTVTTNEARDLLMKGIDGLKEQLITQGVGVDTISVKINETEESSYNSDWTEQKDSNGGNKGREERNQEEKEKGLFEKTIAENLKKQNGKV